MKMQERQERHSGRVHIRYLLDRVTSRVTSLVILMLALFAVLATACATAAASEPSTATPAVQNPTAAMPTMTPTAPLAAAPSAGAAVSPKAYVDLFKDDAVAVLDTDANRVLTTIPVPTGPHGLGITPDGRTVHVSSDGDSKVSAIDTATDKVTRTITFNKPGTYADHCTYHPFMQGVVMVQG